MWGCNVSLLALIKSTAYFYLLFIIFKRVEKHTSVPKQKQKKTASYVVESCNQSLGEQETQENSMKSVINVAKITEAAAIPGRSSYF